MFKSRGDLKNQELNESFVRLAYIAEIKEWDNRMHLERVRRYCQIIGLAAGLTNSEASILGLASQLHDIGKVELPDALLQRTGNYEADEWKIIEKHTSDGSKILDHASSAVLQTASMIALTHHERWDGSGYPRGLKGEEIPISGRICAIADVFDALTTHRSYKASISDEEARKLIENSAGSMFDPKLVEAFSARFDEIRSIKNTLA